ncbi:uncharacterized protein L3040_003841 [Drepanopeziza brunnea f. sp. 'multigermtubi']|uniref:Glucanase B n=1 Tax=Marssonina brunnea f. sp. multigermtubi (strain MB_m1) TaxID=1072389 RepID=K1WRC7_MARBU|nr:glucanase B [Drepanopeziza brunnea f. sp. 'multigermtubi' MB_m1]EKD14962.1 glucanase B [Drepanopeziza brunnea f. sp. 'multigermtubi' MB_m1]KAJ5046602.1 hypothetical protein L3040_003841 [Drepanopeziza brunnea f. sp. 'multigermtubi']
MSDYPQDEYSEEQSYEDQSYEQDPELAATEEIIGEEGHEEEAEEEAVEEEPTEEESVEEEAVEEEPTEEESVEEEAVEEELQEEESSDEQPVEEELQEEEAPEEEPAAEEVYDGETLEAPAENSGDEDRSLDAEGFEITLENRTNVEQVFCYVTGQALDNGNRVCFVKADRRTTYFPENITEVGSEVPEDCAIRLGAPGETIAVTIPHIAGGRIWFSLDQKLTFYLNPGGNGPAIAEPSVTNKTDPNIDIRWGFCEFTYNRDQIYANISYVDFVSLPISMRLETTSGDVQSVEGLYQDGLDSVVAGLRAMDSDYAADWQSLIYPGDGTPLRVLSPNNAHVWSGGKAFAGYYEPYVHAVWARYRNEALLVDTQASYGTLEGRCDDADDGDTLVFGRHGRFARPSTGDVFSCSTGPFRDNQGAMGPLTARISAALNRSTLLRNPAQPTAETVASFYAHDVTNHYARLVHAANPDGRGYAFPYDDVPAPGDVDQSGFVTGQPRAFHVCIGSVVRRSDSEAVAEEGGLE